ncbi:MAG TPA: hypothetical protein VGJ19_02800 [Streptosporangiaceae bacterium]
MTWSNPQMASAAPQNGLSIRTFLLSDGSEDDLDQLRQLLSDHDVLKQCGGELARLTRQGRDAAEEQLASAAAGLLDLDLGDLLIYGWRTRKRIVNAARQTRQAPGRREIVQLGTHRVTSAHEPTIDLLVDGVNVHTFRFQLTVVFDIEVAALVIWNGLLTALKTGDCEVTGSLSLEVPGGNVDLVKARRRISPHLVIAIGHGIPLLPRGAGDEGHRPGEPAEPGAAAAGRPPDVAAQ